MNTSKYDVERSLLQKAVRRGNKNVVSKVVKYLSDAGDTIWLKKRLFTIIYEECWPQGSEITLANITEEYNKVAGMIKNKNAAGLASLAWNYLNGDVGLPETCIDNVQSVACAIKSPGEFWEFIKKEPGYAKNRSRIEAAKIAVSKVGFDYDKALMYAAACLAVEEKIPPLRPCETIEDEFPYWIAFDKHTEKGREIITRASNEIGIDPYKGMQLTFFMAGSQCKEITDSPYWNHFVNWRMNKLGSVVGVWYHLQKAIVELSEKHVNSLLKRINGSIITSQLPLF